MSKCEEEPCKSALSAYNMLILDGMDIESRIQKDCADRRDLSRLFKMLFLMWAAIAGQAALCLILHLGLPWICDLLVTFAFALLALMLLILLGVIALSLRLRANRAKCRDINRRLRDAFAVVRRDCPEECWPADLTQFKCDC